MQSIGGVPIFVKEEDPQFSNSVPSKPIEDGADITDHIFQDPVAINIKFLVEKNGQEVARQLIKLRDASKVFTYEGIDFSYANMAIKSLSIPRTAAIKDGFSGSMQLQQIQMVKERSQVTKLGKEPATGQQVQKNNDNTPKKEPKTTEVPATGRTAEWIAYGERYLEEKSNGA
ncbi:phage baseplate protein [Orenia marismortui]|uniref:Dit-like phage tail protein N-terminal domain-containing protein n=1 Tax=Orenia marismortui TaxID=46469 RepID=A0A4R8GMK0_9FIRM|nr:hypothetical protein [Orenia marismortui]TDX43701.1 hypothetical protein C7959_1594 [Orenia marismortui]